MTAQGVYLSIINSKMVKTAHFHACESALRVRRIAGGILHKHLLAVRRARRTRGMRVTLPVPGSVTRTVM
jgi:hypothetical protein